MSWITTNSEGVALTIRVVPRASKNEIVGLLGDALKIRLQAPPVEGKANKALIEFLADELNVPKKQVEIRGGETGRNKQILIRGITGAEATARLLK